MPYLEENSETLAAAHFKDGVAWSAMESSLGFLAWFAWF
jgi:hypothetical protein